MTTKKHIHRHISTSTQLTHIINMKKRHERRQKSPVSAHFTFVIVILPHSIRFNSFKCRIDIRAVLQCLQLISHGRQCRCCCVYNNATFVVLETSQMNFDKKIVLSRQTCFRCCCELCLCVCVSLLADFPLSI